MTHLRKMMLDELQRRNYAQSTAEAYIRAIRDLAAYYHRPPDRLKPQQIRQFQLHLMRDKGLAAKTVMQRMAAVRFFFVHTLKRSFSHQEFPYPKTPRRLPVILSPDEIRRLIDGAINLLHRTLLMILYSTGMRRSEVVRLKVSDIDSQRMVIHIQGGKGAKDRHVPLSPKLLETLREYWRWRKPKTYLFPTRHHRRGGEPHISSKAVYQACKCAAQRAGIQKKVGPHTLRHSFATHLLEAGADLRTIQLLLGHTEIRDTAIYLNLSQRHLHAFPNPLDGLGVAKVDTVSRAWKRHRRKKQRK